MTEEAKSIYIAPDVRRQTLEEAQDRIEEKRVQRLIMAEKHRQTEADKAGKLHGKNLEKFERQNELFNKAMNKMTNDIEKMSTRLETMMQIHSDMTTLEGIMNDK